MKKRQKKKVKLFLEDLKNKAGKKDIIFCWSSDKVFKNTDDIKFLLIDQKKVMIKNDNKKIVFDLEQLNCFYSYTFKVNGKIYIEYTIRLKDDYYIQTVLK